MTTTLIVVAHPEAASFNGRWAKQSAECCKRAGHRVLWSDLYEMGFDPAERPEHYPGIEADKIFDPLIVQDQAAKAHRLPEIVEQEITKIRAADQLILHFPLWWFGTPAMLKGWFDRVFVHGALHSSTARFDKGLCAAKKVLFCVTTGSSAQQSSASGKEGDIRLLLWPTAYIFRYLGFTVHDPEIVHGVHGFHSGAAKNELAKSLRNALQAQQKLIDTLQTRTSIAFNPDSDFGGDGRLKPSSKSHSAFIRHVG